MADSFQGFKAGVARTHTPSFWSCACAEHGTLHEKTETKAVRAPQLLGHTRATPGKDITASLPPSRLCRGHLQMLQSWVASGGFSGFLAKGQAGRTVVQAELSTAAPEQGGT